MDEIDIAILGFQERQCSAERLPEPLPAFILLMLGIQQAQMLTIRDGWMEQSQRVDRDGSRHAPGDRLIGDGNG
jgi:hypothetical protein